MKDIQSERRRKLLLLGGALAAQACLPMRVARAITLPSLLDLFRRYTASIIPVPNNPYFVPQGGSLAVPLPAGAPFSGTGLPGSATQASTLVLYDTTGPWGWLGQIYATMVGNLASHFGTWVAMPVASYTAGTLQQYSACIYIGSTYGEPLPAAFLTDVYAATTNVIWIYDNIWQLTASQPQFAARYGFMPWVFDTLAGHYGDLQVPECETLQRQCGRHHELLHHRSPRDGACRVRARGQHDVSVGGALGKSHLHWRDPVRVYDRGRSLPDPLRPALRRACPHDRNPTPRARAPRGYPSAVGSDGLLQTAEWLFGNGIPFSFHITARYLDPNGYYTGGVPQDVPLHTQPLMIAAIRTMQALGGVMIHHGYTHQYSNVANPYTAVTGDDCEFYRITASNGVLTYVGPLPGDTDSSWAQGRFDSYAAELAASGLTMPGISTFPAYSGSVPDYRAEAQRFAARGGAHALLSGSADEPDHRLHAPRGPVRPV